MRRPPLRFYVRAAQQNSTPRILMIRSVEELIDRDRSSDQKR
jgi:hypothetical protein